MSRKFKSNGPPNRGHSQATTPAPTRISGDGSACRPLPARRRLRRPETCFSAELGRIAGQPPLRRSSPAALLVAIRVPPMGWEPRRHDRRSAARRADAADRRQKASGASHPRRRLGGRLRLDPRRQLARGAARPLDAASRHPRAARSGERLCRRDAGADPVPAALARARDAGAAEGGRQRGSAERRPLRLLFALPPWRPAPHFLPQAARRRQGDDPRRRRRARRGQELLPSVARPLVARPFQARLERRRQGLGDVRDPRARPRRRGRPRRLRREHDWRSGVDRRTRLASSMSSRTRTTARGE